MQDIYNYLRITANLISESRFGNKLILKGGSALMSKLIEMGRDELIRSTRDIDIHCDKREVWVDFYTNIESILNSNAFGLKYKLVKRRSIEKGLDTSDSLSFEIIDTNLNEIVKFKIDMNIKSNNIISCNFSPILNMMTYDFETMLADKIAAISSQKVFRRIKDVYDLAVLASLKDYSYQNVREHLLIKNSDIVLINMLTQDNFDKLQHAYIKYDAVTHEISLYELIGIDNSFLQPFYINYVGELLWNHLESRWVQN